MVDLQNRWKLQANKLIYYGLRNAPDLFHNEVCLSRRQLRIVSTLPRELTAEEEKALSGLLGIQIVPVDRKKRTPRSLDEATFCRTCAANDYMIPGLEFDAAGRCPLCQTEEETKNLKSVVPIRNAFPRAKKSRFDVAVFYTGGKDSTYLLYVLAKVQRLRVLALTWEIPYMSDSARRSIANARTRLPEVEFVSRRIADADLKRVYAALYARSGNVCACPSLAYVLFYPTLVSERVPYFVVGNEPVQMLGLYYNHMAPRIAYTFAGNRLLNALIDVGRILTLRPPLRPGQFHTLTTMRQLAYGDNPLRRLAGYRNELVTHVTEAIHTVPAIVDPLKRAIRSSSFTGRIPAFVQVDLDAVSGGRYDWRAVKDLIVNECGWVAPDQSDKGLHTSCRIEKCKEHTQFTRFYHMQSDMIPFSALEIALAGRGRCLTREEAVAEIREELGFSLDEIPECAVMRAYLES